MRVLIITNNDVAFYKLRCELLQELLKEYEVYISLPDGFFVGPMVQMGCRFIDTHLNRRGKNPFGELKLCTAYWRLLKGIQPDVVLTYTVKPNVYGGMICRMLGIPQIANMTGLGDGLESGGLLQKILIFLYQVAFKKTRVIFCQNTAILDFLKRNNISGKQYCIIPGSGVNLKQFHIEPYPANTGKPIFVAIMRITRNKGIEEYLYAARTIKVKHPEVTFRLIGDFDQNYQKQVQEAVREGILEYLGFQKDIRRFLQDSWAIIHPSYHEGMANVLLEAAAAGRPVIASDVPGCRETFEEGISGISCKPRDAESLVKAIRKFLVLPHEKKAEMGAAGRAKVESEFDRKIVVDAYMNEIEQILGEVIDETV